MKYEITDKAKENPLLIQLDTGEWVGVGAKYEVNAGSSCGSCSAAEKAVFEKKNARKEKRSFREALPHEYQQIAKSYEKSGGIPGYLIIVPDEPKPQIQPKATPIEKE